MSKGDFVKAVKQADRLLENQGLSNPASTRLWARLSAAAARGGRSPLGRRRWRRGLAAAALGVAALMVAVWIAGPRRPVRLTSFVVSETTEDLIARVRSDDAVELTSGSCTLLDVSSRAELRLSAPATVRREKTGLRVIDGRVEFEVAARPPGAPPLRVLVSAGVIEVQGTRFAVEQGAEAGAVTIYQGHLRFISDDGRTVDLGPGQTLAWPLLPEIAPAPPTAAETPAPPLRPAVSPPLLSPTDDGSDVEALLDQIASLRSRRLYEEAVAELDRALRANLGATTRERLSFERGSILTYLLSDRPRACAHWKAHIAEFGGGRYRRELDQARQSVDCAE